MIADLNSTDIIKKVGGKYRLTALIQRRLDELMQGSRPLIEDCSGKTMLEIVIEEILQDKIAIDGPLFCNESQMGARRQASGIEKKDK